MVTVVLSAQASLLHRQPSPFALEQASFGFGFWGHLQTCPSGQRGSSSPVKQKVEGLRQGPLQHTCLLSFIKEK